MSQSMHGIGEQVRQHREGCIWSSSCCCNCVVTSTVPLQARQESVVHASFSIRQQAKSRSNERTKSISTSIKSLRLTRLEAS